MASAGLGIAAAADAAVARREVLLAQMALHVQNQAAVAAATPRQPSTDRALTTRKPMSSTPGPHHVVPSAACEAMRSIADSLRWETVRVVESYRHVAAGAASAAAPPVALLAAGTGEAGTGGSWDAFPRVLSSVGGTHRSAATSPLVAKLAQLRQYLRKMGGDTAFLSRLPPSLVSGWEGGGRRCGSAPRLRHGARGCCCHARALRGFPARPRAPLCPSRAGPALCGAIAASNQREGEGGGEARGC
jgi:hypothetical protein